MMTLLENLEMTLQVARDELHKARNASTVELAAHERSMLATHCSRSLAVGAVTW